MAEKFVADFPTRVATANAMRQRIIAMIMDMTAMIGARSQSEARRAKSAEMAAQIAALNVLLSRVIDIEIMPQQRPET
jgi:hypothetical protein